MDCYPVKASESDFSESNREDIPEYWSSMYNSEMWFINHELSKHGSCWDKSRANLDKTPLYISQILQNSSNTLSKNEKLNLFLSLTMSWSKNNDIFTILKNGGVTPSDRDVVNPQNIVDVLDNHFKVQGGIFPICNGRKGNKFFTEIRFCLDRNYNVTPCGPSVIHNHVSACSKGMKYPEFPNIE